MGSVIVLSADRTMELINDGFVNASVDVNGDLILSRPDSTSVTISGIKVHGELLGLNEDDHTQYALADGSRGDFASVAQGQKADAARPMINGEVTFDDGEGQLEKVTIVSDGDTSEWPNILEFWFQDTDGLAPRRCFYINETGELRAAPSRWNTVAARFFVKEFANNPTAARSTTVPIVEMMDNRVDRNSLRAWMHDGSLRRNGVRMSECVVLNETDDIPEGTPAMSVIIRVAE